MAQNIAANEDTITGIKVVATRKGANWPLPGDLVAASLDIAVATVVLDSNGGMTISRGGAAAGATSIVVAGGGLTASLDVTVEAATADALTIDESGAVHA